MRQHNFVVAVCLRVILSHFQNPASLDAALRSGKNSILTEFLAINPKNDDGDAARSLSRRCRCEATLSMFGMLPRSPPREFRHPFCTASIVAVTACSKIWVATAPPNQPSGALTKFVYV